MKWMRERDLLIAQTMAFVQSVTGKKPEAEKTVTTSVALLSVETSDGVETFAPETSASMPDIEALLAVSGAISPVPRQAPNQAARPASPERPDLRNDFQSEIKARVANFRAHQERFNREREAYCSATMTRIHAALKEGELPPRLGK